MQTTISVKSHEPINCDGCDHPIPEGQPILSDIPEQIPEDFPREAFRHFHIHCHRCGANSTPCYQLYASRQILVCGSGQRRLRSMRPHDTRGPRRAEGFLSSYVEHNKETLERKEG